MRLRLSLLAVAATLTACVGCGSSDKAQPVSAEAPSTDSSAEESTTSSAPVVAAWPLTAIGVADPAVVNHPAVSVKIDNHPRARPQTGLNQADLVYEIRVEGYTRFAAVFHSELPGAAGPVRSARTSDIDIVANLGTPIFSWSGGNGTVTGQVQGAADAGRITNANFDVDQGDYHRDSKPNGQAAPHNLYVDVAGLQRLGKPGAVPGAIFDYRAPDEALPPGAVPVAGVSLDFSVPGMAVDYVWDPEAHGWARFQTDERHGRAKSAFVDSAGVQVAPANLVVLFMEYRVAAADYHSPEALSVGSGDGMVFLDGAMVPIRWSREAPEYKWRLTTPDGTPVKLNAGRTWVALPEPGDNAKVMAPESAAELLATRPAP